MIWVLIAFAWLGLVFLIVWWFARRGRGSTVAPVVNAQRVSSSHRTPAGRIPRGF